MNGSVNLPAALCSDYLQMKAIKIFLLWPAGLWYCVPPLVSLEENAVVVSQHISHQCHNWSGTPWIWPKKEEADKIRKWLYTPILCVCEGEQRERESKYVCSCTCYIPALSIQIFILLRKFWEVRTFGWFSQLQRSVWGSIIGFKDEVRNWFRLMFLCENVKLSFRFQFVKL